MQDSMQEETLPRKLGVWGIWLLVVNGLIGAGIFGLPSGAARLAGEYSPFIYLFCALLILPIVLCFAEVSSYFRGTGGPIRYGSEAFGPFIGFQAGWLFWAARVISFSANSVLLVDSIGYFWAGAAEGVMRLVMLAVICGGLTVINVIGSVKAIHSLATLTVLKLTALFLLVSLGIGSIGLDVIPTFSCEPPSTSAIGAATLLLIYAFVGFESGVVPAGEARNPASDMPRALILGLLVVAVLYVFIQAVSITVVPDIAESTTPLLDVAAALIGPAGAVLLMLGVLASVGGNLVGAMFSTPRITYALALDRHLPGWFGRVHSRFQTPANSIIFYGVVSFLLAAFGSFIWLAAATVLSRLIMYIISCAAIPRLRARCRKDDSFVLPGGLLFPVLAIASCIWLMLQVSERSLMLTGLFVVGGGVLYAGAAGARRRLR